SPDGKMLASSGNGDAVRLWDATNWKELRTIGGPQPSVESLAFCPNGKCLASADSVHRTVILWEVASGKEVRRFGEQKHPIRKVLFSPDGKNLLASGEQHGPQGEVDMPIHCWDIDTGEEVKRFEGHKGWFKGLALS